MNNLYIKIRSWICMRDLEKKNNVKIKFLGVIDDYLQYRVTKGNHCSVAVIDKKWFNFSGNARFGVVKLEVSMHVDAINEVAKLDVKG